MKLLKIFLSLMFVFMTFVSDAVVDPPDVDIGTQIEATVSQPSNLDVVLFDYALNEDGGYIKDFNCQLVYLIDRKAIRLTTEKYTWNTYCYMSRHRRTKSLKSLCYTIKPMRADVLKDPLIRGHDS